MSMEGTIKLRQITAKVESFWNGLTWICTWRTKAKFCLISTGIEGVETDEEWKMDGTGGESRTRHARWYQVMSRQTKVEGYGNIEWHSDRFRHNDTRMTVQIEVRTLNKRMTARVVGECEAVAHRA